MTHLRVYADREHYSLHHRKALNDILKALWNDAPAAVYGQRRLQFVEAAAPDADIHLLPMKWPYYVEHGLVPLAVRAVEAARKVRRPIAVFSSGDFVASFPVRGSDIHIFQPAAYRSRTDTSNHAIPAFIDDPLGDDDTRLVVRDRGTRPVIGFCGQAGASLARHTVRLVRNRLRRASWRLGAELWEPPPLEHTWFRHRVLESFARSPLVETRFVLRTQYRAGVHTQDRNDPDHPARRAFLENLRDTDYTVCVRGGGNFSVRFYEALAMGRIPAFVDTDCLLPFHDDLEWRHYATWIGEREVKRAPEIVARFHSQLSANEFAELQRGCRRLWRERLTPDGFYAHFHEHFPELA